MKLNLLTVLFNQSYSKILNLDSFDFDVNRRYENDHVNCKNDDIPGINSQDFECEMVNQHRICSTMCKDGKRTQFKCDCNRQVKIITIFDIDSCHWKTIIDAPCSQAPSPPIMNDLDTQSFFPEKVKPDGEHQLQPGHWTEAQALKMLHELSTSQNNAPEVPEIMELSEVAPEKIHHDEDIELEDQSESDNRTEASNVEERHDASSVGYDSTNTANSHVPYCTKLNQPWNCSNSNLIRYFHSQVALTVLTLNSDHCVFDHVKAIQCSK